MVPEVDLDAWTSKTVPITTSARLGNLDKNAQYAVMVAARSKTVSPPPPHTHTRINGAENSRRSLQLDGICWSFGACVSVVC